MSSTDVRQTALTEAMLALPEEERTLLQLMIDSLSSKKALNLKKLSMSLDISFHTLYSRIGRALCHLKENMISHGECEAALQESDNFSSSLADFLPKPSHTSDNGTEANPEHDPPMFTAPTNSDDALWALRAWGERYDHPEFREYIGKFVAVYEYRIVLSGDDPGDVLHRAAELCNVPESRISVDFWEA